MRTCEGCGGVLPEQRGRGRRRKWCSDQCRKRTLYGGTCERCGAKTLSNGVKPPALCKQCSNAASHDGAQAKMIAAIHTFAERYGRPPCASDFNPGYARELGHYWRAERFERDGDYPYLSAVQRVFGSWHAALEAAGFDARVWGEYERVEGARRGAHLEDERPAA